MSEPAEKEFENDSRHYNALTKLFHWSMAVIILGLIVVGFYMQTLPNNPFKFEIYALHKSFGLLILWLVGLRIICRLFTHKPVVEKTHKAWEIWCSKVTHVFLYIAMVGMPLTGWLMSSAGQYPVSFFGFNMPALMGKNPDVAGLMNQAHMILGYVLISAIALHGIGAIKHHIIDGDLTLERMVPKFLFTLWQFLIFIVFILFLGAVLKFTVLDRVTNTSENIEAQTTEAVKNIEVKNIVASNQWQIVKEQSTIQFSSSVYQIPFTSIFSDFDGRITFNPNDLQSSQVEIKIDLKSANSGDANRDAQMMGAEWFDVASKDFALFEVLEFNPSGDDGYIAAGNLTLAGKTVPVVFPFSLDIVGNEEGKRAYMDAKFSLDRLDFGLGGEQWQADDIIAHQVDVMVRLVAQTHTLSQP